LAATASRKVRADAAHVLAGRKPAIDSRRIVETANRNPDDKGDELSRFLNSGMFLKE